MSYKREIKITLTLDEIRTICDALQTQKNSYKDELGKSITKSGRAKKGQAVSRNYLSEELKRTEKLETFFINLF